MDEEKTLYVKYRVILSPLGDNHESSEYAAGRFILGPTFVIGASGNITHCLHWVKEFVAHVTPNEEKFLGEIHASLNDGNGVMFCPDWLYDMGYEPWIIINDKQ